jgi:magnesium chelatase family protein
MLDRIDIHIEVPRVDYEKLSDDRLGEPSSMIQKRVKAAREQQRERFEGTSLTCNADMGPTEIHEYCLLDDTCQSLMRSAMQQMQLSARAFHCSEQPTWQHYCPCMLANMLIMPKTPREPKSAFPVSKSC